MLLKSCFVLLVVFVLSEFVDAGPGRQGFGRFGGGKRGGAERPKLTEEEKNMMKTIYQACNVTDLSNMKSKSKQCPENSICNENTKVQVEFRGKTLSLSQCYTVDTQQVIAAIHSRKRGPGSRQDGGRPEGRRPKGRRPKGRRPDGQPDSPESDENEEALPGVEASPLAARQRGDRQQGDHQQGDRQQSEREQSNGQEGEAQGGGIGRRPRPGNFGGRRTGGGARHGRHNMTEEEKQLMRQVHQACSIVAKDSQVEIRTADCPLDTSCNKQVQSEVKMRNKTLLFSQCWNSEKNMALPAVRRGRSSVRQLCRVVASNQELMTNACPETSACDGTYRVAYRNGQLVATMCWNSNENKIERPQRIKFFEKESEGDSEEEDEAEDSPEVDEDEETLPGDEAIPLVESQRVDRQGRDHQRGGRQRGDRQRGDRQGRDRQQ